MNKERINALALAIAVLEGTDGGYSADEKMRAKMELFKALSEERAKVNP